MYDIDFTYFTDLRSWSATAYASDEQTVHYDQDLWSLQGSNDLSYRQALVEAEAQISDKVGHQVSLGKPEHIYQQYIDHGVCIRDKEV